MIELRRKDTVHRANIQLTCGNIARKAMESPQMESFRICYSSTGIGQASIPLLYVPHKQAQD
ncbi:hypothetical protein [Amycolatopsis anabasis]|uniref:hypothetical protein n=1 Tax=Amycolatopsis anabasis TaxID=1840409 RepID=UPI00131E01D2|nr:hypothetical protein [Amycolatopsis anabasis]